MALTMSVDGFDTSTIGFTVRTADTRRSIASRTRAMASPPLVSRRILLEDSPDRGDRQLEVVGFLKGSTDAEYETRRDALIERCDDGEVEIVFSDQTDRMYRAHLVDMQFGFRTRASLTNDEVALVFDLLDPFARATELSGVSFDATQTLVPMGTAPVEDFTIRIHGAFTNPSIKLSRGGLFHYQPAAGIDPGGSTFTRASTATYRGAGGTLRTAASGTLRDQHFVQGVTPGSEDAETYDGSVIYQADFTLSKSANEWIELDMAAGTIVDESGTSQTSALDTGSDFPFSLDDRYQRHDQQLWLWIETTSGSGELIYRKAFD